MNLLVDTHSFLWFVNDDPQLSRTAHDLISDPANNMFLSVASVWELAIKVGIGKMVLAQPIDVFIPDQLRRTSIQLLPISLDHALRVAVLPPHHRDPFDRLLIAQSLLEPMPIVSVDAVFDAYGVDRRF